MYATSSGDESDAQPMYTDVLEDIPDGIQSRPIINRIEARYNIRGCIKRGQAEWKGAVFSTQNKGKYVHKSVTSVVIDIFQGLQIFGESGSEVSYFIPEPRKIAEVTRLSEDINKYWIKTTMK